MYYAIQLAQNSTCTGHSDTWVWRVCNVFAASAHICRMSPPSITWLFAISWCQRTYPTWNPVPQNPLMGIDIHIFHIISNLKTQTVLVVSQNLFFLSQFDNFCLLTVGVESAVAPNHTHTVGRTPLHEWSAPRRDIHLTHKIHTDRHPFPQRDPNPQSQQARGRRPSP